MSHAKRVEYSGFYQHLDSKYAATRPEALISVGQGEWIRMAWFLRGLLTDDSGSIGVERFEWQRDALHRAAELFDRYGSRVKLELALAEDGVPIRDTQWMSSWNQTGRQLPPKP